MSGAVERQRRLVVAEWNARKKAGDDEAAQLEITYRSWRRLAAEWRRSGVSAVEIDRRMVRLKVQLALHRALNPGNWWRASETGEISGSTRSAPGC